MLRRAVLAFGVLNASRLTQNDDKINTSEYRYRPQGNNVVYKNAHLHH